MRILVSFVSANVLRASGGSGGNGGGGGNSVEQWWAIIWRCIWRSDLPMIIYIVENMALKTPYDYIIIVGNMKWRI